MSFHHVRLVHGSAQNASDRPRRLLLYEYSAADAFPLMGIKDWPSTTATGVGHADQHAAHGPSARAHAAAARAAPGLDLRKPDQHRRTGISRSRRRAGQRLTGKQRRPETTPREGGKRHAGGTRGRRCGQAARCERWCSAARPAIGSALEWYDFYIYGLASALVFGAAVLPEIRPDGRHARGLRHLRAWAFMARPFGGLFFGHFGDRWGASPCWWRPCCWSAADLPDRPAADLCQVGIWAPVLLLLLRLAQGFGAGAEYGGAVVMAVEFAPPGRRGLYGGFAPMGVRSAARWRLASSGWSATGEGSMLAWGWRIPFLVSIVLLGLGVYIRAKVSETPVFQAAESAPSATLEAAGVGGRAPSPAQLPCGGRGAAGGERARLSLPGVRPQLPGQQAACAPQCGDHGRHRGQRRADRSACCSSPGCRTASDAGRSICSARCSRPLSPFRFSCWPDTRDPVLIVLAFIIEMGIGGGAMFGPQAVYFAELFGPRLRYSGFAFARELGSIIAGGPAPLIAAPVGGWCAGAPWGVASMSLCCR